LTAPGRNTNGEGNARGDTKDDRESVRHTSEFGVRRTPYRSPASGLTRKREGARGRAERDGG
jgi:hypothetical protein